MRIEGEEETEREAEPAAQAEAPQNRASRRAAAAQARQAGETGEPEATESAGDALAEQTGEAPNDGGGTADAPTPPIVDGEPVTSAPATDQPAEEAIEAPFYEASDPPRDKLADQAATGTFGYVGGPKGTARSPEEEAKWDAYYRERDAWDQRRYYRNMALQGMLSRPLVGGMEPAASGLIVQANHIADLLMTEDKENAPKQPEEPGEKPAGESGEEPQPEPA